MIVLFIQYMNTIKSICTFSCVLLSLHLWTTPNNSKQQNTKLLLSTVLPCLRCNISGDCYWDCAGTIHGAGWSVCILLAARKEYAACLQRICTMGTNSAQWQRTSEHCIACMFIRRVVHQWRMPCFLLGLSNSTSCP